MQFAQTQTEVLSADEDLEELKGDKITNLFQDFICPICKELLLQPITTKCGHSFCKTCIIRNLYKSNKCPKCKIVIHISPTYGTNVLLNKLEQILWPSEYEKRSKEVPLPIDKFKLPILLAKFVLFPGQKMPLNITEPRYKLMIKRVLEGGGKFGILATVNDTIPSVGTFSSIESHVFLPNGNSLATVVGLEVFHILSLSTQDGYHTACVELVDPYKIYSNIASDQNKSDDRLYNKDINNIPVNIKNLNEKEEKTGQDGGTDKDKDKETNHEISPTKISDNIIIIDDSKQEQEIFVSTKLLFENKMPGVISVIEKSFGKMPDTPLEFSFWLAAILPLPIDQKQTLLELYSPTGRLLEESRILNGLSS